MRQYSTIEPLLSNVVSSSANRHRTGLRATIPAARIPSCSTCRLGGTNSRRQAAIKCIVRVGGVTANINVVCFLPSLTSSPPRLARCGGTHANAWQTLPDHTEQNRQRVSLCFQPPGWHWEGEAAFNSLGAGRAGDPSPPPRNKWRSPTFSATPVMRPSRCWTPL